MQIFLIKVSKWAHVVYVQITDSDFFVFIAAALIQNMN